MKSSAKSLAYDLLAEKWLDLARGSNASLANASYLKLMSPTEKRHTKNEVIENAWDALGSDSLGVRELELIQSALEQTFGRTGIESPARIARTLADLGVPLRHPEILNADLIWREAQVEKLFEEGEIDFGTIELAVSSVKVIEMRRIKFLELGDDEGVESLKEHVREIKAELTLLNSELAVEIVEWLAIWLQNSEIFSDWLDLRQKSPEFVGKFE